MADDIRLGIQLVGTAEFGQLQSQLAAAQNSMRALQDQIARLAATAAQLGPALSTLAGVSQPLQAARESVWEFREEIERLKISSMAAAAAHTGIPGEFGRPQRISATVAAIEPIIPTKDTTDELRRYQIDRNQELRHQLDQDTAMWVAYGARQREAARDVQENLKQFGRAEQERFSFAQQVAPQMNVGQYYREQAAEVTRLARELEKASAAQARLQSEQLVFAQQVAPRMSVAQHDKEERERFGFAEQMAPSENIAQHYREQAEAVARVTRELEKAAVAQANLQREQFAFAQQMAPRMSLAEHDREVAEARRAAIRAEQEAFDAEIRMLGGRTSSQIRYAQTQPGFFARMMGATPTLKVEHSGIDEAAGALRRLRNETRETSTAWQVFSTVLQKTAIEIGEGFRGQRGQQISTFLSEFRRLGTIGAGISIVPVGIGIALAGVERLAAHFAQLGQQTQNAATAAGLSVDEFSHLQRIFQLVDGDSNKLARTLDIVARSLMEAAQNPLSVKGSAAQRMFGPDYVQVIEQGLKDPIHLLDMLRHQFQALPEDMRRSGEFAQLFRDELRELAPILMLTDREIGELGARVDRTGSVFTSAMIPRMEAAARASHELGEAFSGLGLSLALLVQSTGFTQWLISIVEGITSLARKIEDIKPHLEGLGAALGRSLLQVTPLANLAPMLFPVEGTSAAAPAKVPGVVGGLSEYFGAPLSPPGPPKAPSAEEARRYPELYAEFPSSEGLIREARERIDVIRQQNTLADAGFRVRIVQADQDITKTRQVEAEQSAANQKAIEEQRRIAGMYIERSKALNYMTGAEQIAKMTGINLDKEAADNQARAIERENQFRRESLREQMGAAERQISINRYVFQMQRAFQEQRVYQGQISPVAGAREEIAAVQQMAAQEEAAYQHIADIAGNNAQIKMEALERYLQAAQDAATQEIQLARKVAEEQKRQAEEASRVFVQAFDRAGSSVEDALTAMLTHSETRYNIMKNLFMGLDKDLIHTVFGLGSQLAAKGLAGLVGERLEPGKGLGDLLGQSVGKLLGLTGEKDAAATIAAAEEAARGQRDQMIAIQGQLLQVMSQQADKVAAVGTVGAPTLGTGMVPTGVPTWAQIAPYIEQRESKGQNIAEVLTQHEKDLIAQGKYEQAYGYYQITPSTQKQFAPPGSALATTPILQLSHGQQYQLGQMIYESPHGGPQRWNTFKDAAADLRAGGPLPVVVTNLPPATTAPTAVPVRPAAATPITPAVPMGAPPQMTPVPAQPTLADAIASSPETQTFQHGGIAGLDREEVPAILHRGERVLNLDETRRYHQVFGGMSILDAMPKFQEGGVAGGSTLMETVGRGFSELVGIPSAEAAQKLTLMEKATAPIPGLKRDTTHYVVDEFGKPVAEAAITKIDEPPEFSFGLEYVDKTIASIGRIAPLGGTVFDFNLKNLFGAGTMKDLVRQYFEQNPDVDAISGIRATGARMGPAQGEFGTVDPRVTIVRPAAPMMSRAGGGPELGLMPPGPRLVDPTHPTIIPETPSATVMRREVEDTQLGWLHDIDIPRYQKGGITVAPPAGIQTSSLGFITPTLEQAYPGPTIKQLLGLFVASAGLLGATAGFGSLFSSDDQSQLAAQELNLPPFGNATTTQGAVTPLDPSQIPEQDISGLDGGFKGWVQRMLGVEPPTVPKIDVSAAPMVQAGGIIDSTGLALVHQGEIVVPAQVSPLPQMPLPVSPSAPTDGASQTLQQLGQSVSSVNSNVQRMNSTLQQFSTALAGASSGQSAAAQGLTGLTSTIGTASGVIGAFANVGKFLGFLGLFEKGGVVPFASRGMVVAGLPSFQGGGILSVLHPYETVLPASLTDFLMRAASNTINSSPSSVENHYHNWNIPITQAAGGGFDAPNVARLFRTHGEALVSQLTRQNRLFNRNVPRR